MPNNPTLSANTTATGDFTVSGLITVDALQMSEIKGGLHLASGGTDPGQAPLYFLQNSNLLTVPENGAVEFDTNGLYVTNYDNFSADLIRFSVLAGIQAAHSPVSNGFSAGNISSAYGASASGTVLLEPDVWIRVNLGPESFIIPAYYESV